MNLAKKLLENKKEYNGHKQFEIPSLTVKEARKICNKLEEIDPEYSFVVELWTDGSITIYQKDYWGEGVHPLGHKDRVILSSSDD